MKRIILFFFLSFSSLNAQELNDHQLDSLYNSFLRMRGFTIDESEKPATEPKKNKCGFVVTHYIESNLERFSLEKQHILTNLLQRPERETSSVSPSGFFRIHYNTTGSETPRYNSLLSIEQNVELVGIALDSTYNFEVNYLDYPAPPPDNGNGGDNKYDVYILNLGDYGYTKTETSLGNQKYTSYMAIDNDYIGFQTSGLRGMQVTVAHEFHHGIQVGGYTADKLDFDPYFYEITSTAMEEFVYDSVNDYYFYMPDYFNFPHRAFANNNGYNLAAWNIYLRDKYGYNILKRQWEMLPSLRALAAIHNSLIEVNSSFKDAFNEFGLWTYFTGSRTKPGEYFEEAANYPLIQYTTKIPLNPASTLVKVKANPTSNNFVVFINSAVSPVDSLVALITNGDYVNGIGNPSGNYEFDYTLGNGSLSGSTKLTDLYFVKINVEEPLLWSITEILNYFVIRQNGIITPPIENDGIFVYPNPFYYNQNYNSLFIVTNDVGVTEYDFNVYTSAMELVYTDVLPVLNKTIRWDIKSKVKEKLSSGIYIFSIRSGDKTSLGKLVIFNE